MIDSIDIDDLERFERPSSEQCVANLIWLWLDERPDTIVRVCNDNGQLKAGELSTGVPPELDLVGVEVDEMYNFFFAGGDRSDSGSDLALVARRATSRRFVFNRMPLRADMWHAFRSLIADP